MYTSPSAPPPIACYGFFFSTVTPSESTGANEQERISNVLYWVIAVPLWLVGMSVPAKRPKLFWMSWLLHLFLFGALFSPNAANARLQCTWVDGIIAWGIGASLMLLSGLWVRHRLVSGFLKRVEKIEGDLVKRLADGSLGLLRVAWLLEQPADWVLQRRQDIPEAAFWSPADAVHLLKKEKVAALSYKWQGPFNSSNGGGDQPDGVRFHLDAVLAYFRQGKHAEQRPALMWDFASVPQHHPVTGEKRTESETCVFRAGLSVMTNAYASPRVLVLQHRKILPELEMELNNTFGGKPPADRLDLIPYAGEHCRSGWCTSESACALLMTAGGGHAYELGVGKVSIAPGKLPSLQEMKALFHDESTRFIGNADRATVSDAYLKLRTDFEGYDYDETPAIGRFADTLMTGEPRGDNGLVRVIFVMFMLVPTGIPILLASLIMTRNLGINRMHAAVALFLRIHLLLVVPLILAVISCGVTPVHVTTIHVFSNTGFAAISIAGSTLPSPMVRAHLAVFFGYRSRDSLEHSFHCSLIQPPFRKITLPLRCGDISS